MSFQGLGALSDLTSSKILSVFSERLESMSWGIAQRFKHVLLSLQREHELSLGTPRSDDELD